MSRKAKLKAREVRKAAKRARKDANRARFAAMVGTEANRKKKRGTTEASRGRKHTHPDGMCGNSACVKCTKSEANDPWLAERGSCLYGKRWTSPLHRTPMMRQRSKPPRVELLRNGMSLRTFQQRPARSVNHIALMALMLMS